jgi:hypothetical protein
MICAGALLCCHHRGALVLTNAAPAPRPPCHSSRLDLGAYLKSDRSERVHLNQLSRDRTFCWRRITTAGIAKARVALCQSGGFTVDMPLLARHGPNGIIVCDGTRFMCAALNEKDAPPPGVDHDRWLHPYVLFVRDDVPNTTLVRAAASQQAARTHGLPRRPNPKCRRGARSVAPCAPRLCLKHPAPAS